MKYDEVLVEKVCVPVVCWGSYCVAESDWWFCECTCSIYDV